MTQILSFSIILISIIIFVFSANSVEENEWAYHNASVINKVTSDSTTRSCDFEDKSYSDGQRMKVNNPCIHCFCDQGKAKCFRENCPPPPVGCQLLDNVDSNSCKSSIYNCTIPPEHQKPLLRRDSKIYGQRKRGLGLVRADCLIRGIAYLIGETVGVASSTCLQCRCANHSLLCLPLCCYEPILATARNRDRVPLLFHRSVHQRDPHPLEHLY